MNIVSLFAETTSYDSTYYTTSTGADAATSAAAAMGIILFALVFALIAYVVFALLLSRIFKKAGVERWKAWVPVYNSWVMLELGGQKGFWAVLALVPIVNIVSAVFMYIAMYNIGLKLGKDGAFVLLAIFLPIVWLIWLAVDSSTWKGAPVAAQAGSAPKPPVTDSSKDTTPPNTPTV
jgi:hypothetical protein